MLIPGVLAVLLGIYNFAVDDIRQKRDPHLWRDVYFPDLAKPSLYHRPVVGSRCVPVELKLNLI